MPTTSYPSCRNARATCAPMKPATPVINIFSTANSLAADDTDQCVTPPGADQAFFVTLLELLAENFCESAHTARPAVSRPHHVIR